MEGIASLWSRKPERLGVDFDSRSVRVVRLSRKGEESFEIASCGLIGVSLRAPTPLDQQRLGAFLKQVGAGLNRAAVGIDDASLRIRHMNFAKMPERDLLEAIKWNFREHIDVPIEDYEVGHTQIDGWGEPDRPSYCAFGVAKKAIREHVEMMRQVGLKVVALEPQATALLAAFDYNINWPPKQTIICICLGEQTTYFTVMADAQLLFSRPMPGISYDALTKLVSGNMNVDEKGAKEMLSGNSRPELAETMSTFYSQLVVETQRSIDAFTILFGVEHVDSIYLCGIGAYCPGIIAHMQKSLGVPTQIFDPFASITKEKLDPAVASRSAIFAVAFGLAIP